MKINNKILSIPPYISTSWKNVASLHVENQLTRLVLVITLLNGTRIEIPDLDTGILKAVFTAHALSIEAETSAPATQQKIIFPAQLEQIFSMGLSIKGESAGLENLGSLLQHNADQADSPSLPAELMQKLTELSKTLGIKDNALIPQPEPECNCMHCQIANALRRGLVDEAAVEPEEIVHDDELKFRTWDIAQTGDKLFAVSNPLDSLEHYNVYLGEPLGCTCGQNHCEHIRAVLNS